MENEATAILIVMLGSALILALPIIDGIHGAMRLYREARDDRH